MDYGKLISRAFQITFKYKFLWFLGILASLASGGANIPSYSFNFADLGSFLNNQTTPSENYRPQFESENILGAQTDWLTSFSNWLFSHLFLVFGLLILLFILFLFLFIVSKMAQGGLIASVYKIEKNQPASFKIGFKDGYHAFWRLFGIGVLIALVIAALLIVLGLPVLLLTLIGIYWAAGVLGIFVLPILIFASIFLGILLMHAMRYAVCQKTGVLGSIKNAYRLMKNFKKEIILIWLISVGIAIIAGMVLGLVALFVIAPVFILGVLIFKAFGIMTTFVYSVILGLIICLGLLLVSGIINTFVSSFWTLAFVELTKKTVDKH